MTAHPWQAEMERLRARTREPGRASPDRAASTEGRLVDGEGRLYSHGTTTCLILAGGKA